MQSCCTSNVMMVVVGMHLCCVITDRLSLSHFTGRQYEIPFLISLCSVDNLFAFSFIAVVHLCSPKGNPANIHEPRENIANREITEGKLGVLGCQVMFQFG